jgi:hypothetical protein
MGSLPGFVLSVQRLRWVCLELCSNSSHISDFYSAMAYGLVQIKNTTLRPWQLVFVVEAAVRLFGLCTGDWLISSRHSFVDSWSSSFFPIVLTNVDS